MVAREDLSRLGRGIRDLEDRGLATPPRRSVDERLARVHAALGRRQSPRSRAFPALRAGAGALAFAVAVAALFAFVFRGSHAPLAFTVGDERAPGAVGVWVAAESTAVPLGFSDGTSLVLDPSGRARVVAITEHGARVVLERGRVHASVVPRSGNDWSVIGGPFEIHVTGTVFEASWDPAREELTVAMREGKVEVRGACLTEARKLAAGESATIGCGARPEAQLAPSGSPSASAAPSSARPSAPAPASSDAARAAANVWRDRAQHGDYKGALAAAEETGFDDLLERLSAADLLELGTVARLGGKPARARTAYLALRRRFSGGDAAATAAFHLGQMAFDGAGAFAEAQRWFGTYLAERPSGALAAEALGRTMEAQQRSGDTAGARATADQYVARFPNGAHAALAKSLLAP